MTSCYFNLLDCSRANSSTSYVDSEWTNLQRRCCQLPVYIEVGENMFISRHC